MKVNNLSMGETMDAIDGLVKQGGSHLVVTLGVEMVMRAESDRDFFSISNDASLVVPDSVGILWAGKRAGCRLKERVSGIDIITQSARQRDKYPWKIYFLGAGEGTAEKAARRLMEEYPGYNIVGHHHGFFAGDDNRIIDEIKASGTQVLFVALGSPYQEKWFQKHRDELGDIVAIGVGGSFDVLAGTLKRAPGFMRKLGLEWFYRLVTQPSRAGRMLALPRFAAKVLLREGAFKQTQ